MGVASWYRRFLQNFSTITAPITELTKTKNSKKFAWTPEAQTAFEEIQRMLTSTPVLTSPTLEDPWFLETDASDVGVGAVLKQIQNGEEKIIAFFSKKLSTAARKYTVTERECLAVILAIEAFRCYIEGAPFTVITDHASLKWLQNLKDPQGRLARWALRLQAYDYKIIHRPGSQMILPDALSRAVCLIDLEEIQKCPDADYQELLQKVKAEPTIWPQYCIRNEILYRNCNYINHELDSQWKIVVPESKRAQVLYESHDDVFAAHGGIFKTLNRIRQDYYWPKMKHDVIQYVRKCQLCKCIKATNQCQTAPMGSDRSPDKKFQAISLDYIGPLPLSKKGHRWILVTIDDFTKFVTIHPMKTATAKKTVELIDEHIVTKYGAPERFILDNGTQLRAKLFMDYAKSKKIQLWYTPHYHPSPNATEAANKTLVTGIRAYIKDETSHREWDQNLTQLACVLNNSIHTSTTVTPFFAVFGEKIALTGEDHQMRIGNEEVETGNEKYRRIQEKIMYELDRAYQKRAKQYDLRTRKIEYHPGDVVYKKNTKQSKKGHYYMSKLDHKYDMVIIHQKIGSNCYKLREPDGGILPGKFSVQQLKA